MSQRNTRLLEKRILENTDQLIESAIAASLLDNGAKEKEFSRGAELIIEIAKNLQELIDVKDEYLPEILSQIISQKLPDVKVQMGLGTFSQELDRMVQLGMGSLGVKLETPLFNKPQPEKVIADSPISEWEGPYTGADLIEDAAQVEETQFIDSRLAEGLGEQVEVAGSEVFATEEEPMVVEAIAYVQDVVEEVQDELVEDIAVEQQDGLEVEEGQVEFQLITEIVESVEALETTVPIEQAEATETLGTLYGIKEIEILEVDDEKEIVLSRDEENEDSIMPGAININLLNGLESSPEQTEKDNTEESSPEAIPESVPVASFYYARVAQAQERDLELSLKLLFPGAEILRNVNLDGVSFDFYLPGRNLAFDQVISTEDCELKEKFCHQAGIGYSVIDPEDGKNPRRVERILQRRKINTRR